MKKQTLDSLADWSCGKGYCMKRKAPMLAAGLRREDAAEYVGLSVSTFEKAVREGRAPQARQVADRRVVWLRKELDTWLEAAPISNLLPPENTGAKKPRHPLASLRVVVPAGAAMKGGVQ